MRRIRTALTAGQKVRDLTGRGNDLTVATVPGTAADALTWHADHRPRPARARRPEVRRRPEPAARRVSDGRGHKTPLNAEQFRSGYTTETFVLLPLDRDAGNHDWAAILSRRGSAGAAGKHGRNTTLTSPCSSSPSRTTAAGRSATTTR